MKGIYQVKDSGDFQRVKELGFDTVIADIGQESILMESGLNILVQINPDWDFEKTVRELDPSPQVIGYYLPDEPNMDPYITPESLALTVAKIKKISQKPVCVCIANINSGRDYVEWKRCGADILFADIYPYKANPEHWYRKFWEQELIAQGKLAGRIFRFFYGWWRCFEDSFRMKKAVKADYPVGTIAVLQCFGGKDNSGSERKFYLPNKNELERLMRCWKNLGVTDFVSFVWESDIHNGIKENQWMAEIVNKE